MIPCTDPKAQFLAHRDAIRIATERVLESGRYILGTEVSNFEQEFAAFCETKFAVGVGNGTDALFIALTALGIKSGDEVITTAHTAVATATAIRLCGATPVFADIDPQTLTLDAQAAEKLITKKTKALLPVHLYGHPVDLDAWCDLAKRKGLPLIEDCAQAHGAKWRGKTVGSFGEVGCFSFYPTKNLGAIGDGGGITTSDSTLAQKMRELREYGWQERYISANFGWNSRLDELQAAILRVKLKHLANDNAKRRAIAERYLGAWRDLPLTLPSPQKEAEPVFHLFVAQTSKRSELQKYLLENGVSTGVHYPVPIHQQPAYQSHCQFEKLLITEQAAQKVLSFPIFPELSDTEINTVITAVTGFFANSLYATL